jgi:hypothetical protein
VAWAPPAQPLVVDRRDPPVLLSLLLSVGSFRSCFQTAEL